MSAATATKLSWYSFDKLLSYNGVYNFCLGARGLGKTYGAKKNVIKAFLKRGDQFILLRRYKEELKSARDTFFADLEAKDEFPDWDFRANGDKAEIAPRETRDEKKRPWVVIGYFIPLSTAQSQKGRSFPMVKTIIFDEFIIEKGMTHYLPNEAKAFNNFYSTVDRWQDKTRVLFLANSVSMMNPYFLEYDIKPDQVGEWHTISAEPGANDNFIVCHFADSADFQKEVYQTRFGKFIQNTEYADYAVGNTFSDSHQGMIAFKPSAAKYFFTLETRAGVFSVWVDWNGPYFYCQAKRPKREIFLTMLAERMDNDKILAGYSDHHVAYLRAAFNNGNAYFDEPKTRNAFAEIFKR